MKPKVLIIVGDGTETVDTLYPRPDRMVSERAATALRTHWIAFRPSLYQQLIERSMFFGIPRQPPRNDTPRQSRTYR